MGAAPRPSLRAAAINARGFRTARMAISTDQGQDQGSNARQQQEASVPVRGAAAAAPRPASTKPPIGLWDVLTKYEWGNQDPGVPLPYRDGVAIAAGAAPETTSAVTQAHLDELFANGVVHIPGVLTNEWVEYLRACTDWQIAHPHIWAVPGVASGLYDYIQRSAWTTNAGFAKFLYYSPISSVLAKCAECGWFPEGDARGFHEVRLSTDLLMVNPNKGFKWHQDNQNGPLTSGHGGDKLDALRFWVTMDETPADYGAPVYLRKSHENKLVGKDEVFVSLEAGDLPQYSSDVLEFRPRPGDMIIWHPRSIHKVDGAPDGNWQGGKRRVLGGTVAIDDAKYQGNKKANFADMGTHQLKQDDLLNSPFFPIIYPISDPKERAVRDRGGVGRSFEGFQRMVGTLMSKENMEQFSSWAKVVQNANKVAWTNDPFIKGKPSNDEIVQNGSREHKK